MINGIGETSQCEVNPLDLVTAVFMSANTFLQQEMIVRMVQCQFAVPLVLPNIDPEESSRFLLWPLRGVSSQWKSHFPDTNRKVHEGDLASTSMPVVSCVKLGHCGVSKSKVLNNVINGIRFPGGTFLHRGMEGGELPRRFSNGLIEISWYLPTGETARDIFPVPVVISNLRGDAGTHEKNLHLLCQASSAVVVFCGNLREKEKQLLAFCKDTASKLIVVDLSDTEKNENRVVGFVDQNLEKDMGLPEGSVLQGGAASEEELADKLCDILKDLLPDKLKPVTLEAAAKLAEELGYGVDEGGVCKKAMATVEEVLKGLDEGPTQFREKHLPLQGPLWSKLAKVEKEERKQRKKVGKIDPQLLKEKKDILVELSSYKMTPAMKIFTDALSTTDKVERTCFLSWMKLKLQQMQTEKQNSPQGLFTDLQTEKEDGIPEHSEELENGSNAVLEDNDSFCTDSTFEEENIEELPENTELQVSEQQFETDQELEHISPESAEKTIEPQSQQEEHLELAHLPGEEQLDMMSNEKMGQGEEIIENNVFFEKQISDPVFEDQDHQPEFGENASFSCQEQQQDEPELTLTETDSTSPAQQQMGQNVTLENQVAVFSQPFEPDPPLLGLEHFLREMGLIFELTHISPGSGSHNVLRLPSLATDLLLYGVPLEIMDGDASNIPMCWLSCVIAELKRRLPQEHCRVRVLTSLGVHDAKNAEVLSALFGVKFPEGRNRSTRGVYMTVLCLPNNLREDMECDYLLLIDVEGLCLDDKSQMVIQDNEIATVAVGLSDVLMQNITSHVNSEFETNFSVVVNALLRIKEHGSMPICQLLIQDESLNSILQASQLKRVSDMLQTETRDGETNNADNHTKTTSCITCVKGPWNNMSLHEPIDVQYSEALLKLKQNLFGALKRLSAKSEARGLPEIMSRLCDVWEAVRTESFSIGLQNTDIAVAFSLLCTELSQWEDTFQETMESWFMGATKKIVATKAKALEAAVQNGLLNELKDEAKEKIKTGVDKLRSKVDAYLMKDDFKLDKFKPVLMSNMNDLQEQVTEEIIQRLEAGNESHCSSTQLRKFETLLDKEQEIKLQALIENSKSTKVLLQDAELEEEFEGVWSNILSNFDFRPSERDDITTRVTVILRENLLRRGLQKHMKKLEIIGQDQPSTFYVYDEHFGYRSRLKHMFEDNNRLQRLEAQKVAGNIIEEYNQLVADKSSSPADFSDSYITELLDNIEKALKDKSMEIRSAFEVDLKVYLCNAACQDFQKVHDRYAKDRELLTCITETKSKYLAEFIYQFRKRDQCQRVAQAFTSMVIKPTVLDYIYGPMGMRIVEEIKGKALQYQSQCAFHQSLLEELIKEDCFESFLEYLDSYDNFRLKKIQETLVAHVSESSNFDKWRQQRLGEIVGKIAAAVSETAEGTNGVLSDSKPLLERVCLTLEKDGDVDVTRAPLEGPLFSITTEWDRFVTCLMELLAAMRLDLAQEFSQNLDTDHFLQCLPVQPHDYLFNKVKGCEKQCPLCRAPCEVEEMGHEVHRAVLHRPKGMLPYNSCSLPSVSCPESMTAACRGWSISPEDPNNQMSSAYWRYCAAH